MRLDRILHKVNNEPWAILPTQHAAIRQLLEAHLAGAPFPQYDHQEDESAPYAIVGNTAVIDVCGVLLNKCSGLESLCGAFSLEAFRSNLKTVAALDAVKNIVLNISSGGGTVTGIPETADLIAQVSRTKNIYAYTSDCIASAAYWLASQCKAVFVSKSAEVGSIGVYSYLIDTSRAFEMQGLKAELFKSGQYKAAGIDGVPLSDAQRAQFQASVDKTYSEFTAYVTAKRSKVPADAMQGQMFDSEDAQANGLIDGIINDLDALIAYLNGK